MIPTEPARTNGSEGSAASAPDVDRSFDYQEPPSGQGCLFRFLLGSVIWAIAGLALTLTFQAAIPHYPEVRSYLIAASVVALVITCGGPLAVATVESYRLHRSLRPALATIAWVLVVGAIWSALTSRGDSDEE